MTIIPVSQISSYHAHIYFNGTEERQRAALLRQQVAERFTVQLGRWHEQPIGPHQYPMYQIAFAVELFTSFVPWLLLNRQDLIMLIHPDTGHARADHLHHALWLGRVLTIMQPDQLPEHSEREIIIPNTRPTSRP